MAEAVSLSGGNRGGGGRIGRGSTGRGAALKDAMRKALAKKSGDAATTLAPPKATSETCGSKPSQVEADDEIEDPWPEVRIAATSSGVEDARSRALELRRQGAFEDAAKMWAKVVYIARQCNSISGAELADYFASQAEALLFAEDWAGCERVCLRAAHVAFSTPADVRLLCTRARSRAEMGHVEAARVDMAQALARELDSMDDSMDDLHEQARELEVRIRELEQERTRRAAESAAAAAEAARQTATCAPPQNPDARFVPAARAPQPKNPIVDLQGKSEAEHRQDGPPDEASTRNQAFFARMDRDFSSMCASDGWEEILQAQKELLSSPTSFHEEIDPESDYFKVHIPAGAAQKEIRPSPSNQAAAAVIAACKRAETRPRRNLDELRRVEKETKEAIEEERRLRAARESEPIRTRSDVVRIDDLDDELSDGDDDLVNSLPATSESDIGSLDEAPDGQVEEQARKTMEALQEFDRLAREKEARLAKWRERYG